MTMIGDGAREANLDDFLYDYGHLDLEMLVVRSLRVLGRFPWASATLLAGKMDFSY